MRLTNLTVLLLVGNEDLHIERCLRRLHGLAPQRVIMVESLKGDCTHEVAVRTGLELGWNSGPGFPRVETVWHDWPGSQAVQFNWIVDNYEIETRWVLRIDADEWLTPELIEEIRSRLPLLPNDVSGVVLKRRHYFSGGWAKRGTYPVRILRLFRTGKARYDDDMVMDEHLIVDGKTIEFNNDFVDETLISMGQWREKHRGYAKREAKQALEGLRTGKWTDPRKAKYYRLPPYFRAVAYFCLRYFVKGGFLDGYAGWMWNFWQGLWYRWIVDREIGKLRRAKKV